MSKARDVASVLNEGTMKDGIWVILLGTGGVLDREFVENKSDIKKILSKWADSLDVGDTIKIEAGSSES